MDNDLTIARFAELVGVSTQSIYKRLQQVDNPLQPFTVKKGKKTLIKKAAALEVYGIEVEEEKTAAASPNSEEEKTAAASPNSEDIITVLTMQLQEKDRQLQEKDRQIKALMDNLAEATTLVKQAQQLHATDKVELLRLESIEQKRKGLFRIFKKK